MATIIHVDDGQEWIDLVRRALADHRVDSARTYDEALRLIREGAVYDLALIDLNLAGDDDVIGGEILDLLRVDFPATRRVVITGSPPAGDLRSGLFERYGLADVIIKGKTTLPGLRLVVNRALWHGASDVPKEVRLEESEIMSRYQNFRSDIEEEIRTHVRDARVRAREGARGFKLPHSTTRGELNDWLALRQRFADVCASLEAELSSARTIDEVKTANDRFETIMQIFRTEMSRLD